MSDVNPISKEEFDRQEERLRKLAQDKANVQLIVNLMASLSSVQGLDDTVTAMLQIVLEHVGGTHLSVFYKIDDSVFYADVLGERRKLDALEDPLVRRVFETREFLEQQHDFSDTRMMTPEFTCASTWVFPLAVGSDLVGVFKIESMHILARHLQAYLPTFFSYAALILKNEILGYTRLQKAYSQLEREVVERRRVEQELREAKAGLEEKVTERTAELLRANRLYDVLSHVNQATVRVASSERLFSEVCRIATGHGQFHLAWIGLFNWETLEVLPVAYAGPGSDYASQLKLSFRESPEEWGPARNAIREGRCYVTNNLAATDSGAHWHSAAMEAGFRSEVAVPIRLNGAEDGVLVICSLEGDVFHDREIALLEEIAADISMGLDRIYSENERRRAEKMLREKTEELDRYFLNALDLLCIADTDGYFRRLNPEWEATLGYPLRELEGKRFLDLVHPDDRAATLDAVDQLAANKEVLNLVNRYRCKNGEYRWIEWRAFPAAKLIYAVARDITEHKEALEALRRSEERHRTILQTALDGFWLTDTEGRLLEVNDTCCRITGYSAQELLSMRVSDLEAVETPEETAAHIRRIAAQGKDRFETQHRCKDGSVIDVEISAQYRAAEGGSLVTFVRDITERKRAEAERERLQAQLSQAQKMESVGRLAGGVAHDFNNMLAVIAGNAELALKQVDRSQTLLHAELQEIHKAAVRSADLTRQLLAFARKQTVAPKVLDLNEAVTGMLKMLQRLIGENIELVWIPGPGLGQVKIDPSQIDQILANLCVNARDSITDVGRVTIETGNSVLTEECCAGDAGVLPGDYVRLSVTDNGCGMDEDTLSHIFEPFFTTKALGKGTGLGLATVYGAVQQNNGFVQASSALGKGTTIAVYLPRYAAKPEQSRAAAPAENVAQGHATILVVEDETSILNMCRAMLEKLGYTVLTASTPGEAIRLAETHPTQIDLLMTDVIMPEMSGRDLAKNLLALYPRMKRLFMSGYTADVIAYHGILNKGVHFIQKPFSLEGLAAKVSEALEDE